MNHPALFKPSYPQDFEGFWKVYGPVKNASKPDAFKAFRQVKPHLPSYETLAECVRLYRSWLAVERKKKPDYPQCHAASWLRQHKWESWMETAQANLAHQATPSQALTFPDHQREQWLKLETDIGTPTFTAYFTGAKFEDGTLFVAKSFIRDRILYRHSQAIQRSFGAGVRVEVW